MTLSLLIVLSCVAMVAIGCTVASDCGSVDNTQPGLCISGVCQCGFGYAGNALVDPSACTLSCTPVPVPDSIAFLAEPIVSVAASAGNLTLDVDIAPYLKQTPATMALLHPVNGSRCALMPNELGLGVWSQSVGAQCVQRYSFKKAFASAVGQQCWEAGAPSTETGSQFAITFNSYRTQVEVIQRGLAPFGQSATPGARRQARADETTIERAFRRDYTISVATSFRAQSAPFSVIAPTVIVPPTAVDDAISTPQKVPVVVSVLSNDISGTTGGETEPMLYSTLRLTTNPAHGTATVNTTTGAVTYTPTGLYHGADSFVYEICDANANCDQATVSVTVTPVPPVAAPDAAQTPYETAVTVDVLANDVAGAGPIVSLTIVSGAGATVTANNQVTYVPPRNFTGLANITYRVCDASTPTVLCSEATLVIDVGGLGPVAVADTASVAQNGGAVVIPVLSNDLAGTSPLNPAAVTIVSPPTSGTATVNPATGSISYTPATGFHGTVTLTYQVCDLAGACMSATVTITVTPRGPDAKDDSAATTYATAININVLANDVAGAQPLVPASVSIVSPPASNMGIASVGSNGAISFVPASGFTGSATLTYQVCDSSTPSALCDTALVTIVVNGLGVSLRYRLVKIDYDVLGHAIGATVQTQTAAGARVSNVALGLGSTGLAPIVSGPTTGVACDAGSALGSCDQFHTIRFSDNPCAISGAELVLNVKFECSSGAGAATCGYVSAAASYRLDKLFLTYDACPRVVQYGVDSQKSFLRLHEDVARATPLASPALLGSTLYGRCSVQPTQGATFQSVTLSSMAVMRQSAAGPVNMGNQLSSTFLTLLSGATQTSPTNPTWDFNLLVAESFFNPTETYYLEATLDLIFANTGPLTRRLVIPIRHSTLRATAVAANKSGNELVAVFGRAADPSRQAGVFSQTFRMVQRASNGGAASATSAAAAVAANSQESSTTMIAAIAGGIGAALIAACVIVAIVLVRRRRDQRERANSDTPLVVLQSGPSDFN